MKIVSIKLRGWVVRPMEACVVHTENKKIFKIFRHIEFFDTCMKH